MTTSGQKQTKTTQQFKNSMILTHSKQPFEFSFTGSGLNGVLVLNSDQSAELRKLVDAEPEDWYLDRTGERLPPDKLFEASPWAMETVEGPIKILNRLLNLETGEAAFNVPDTYAGEWHRWIRSEAAPKQF